MAISALLHFVLASLMLVGTSAFAGTILVWGDSLSAGYGLQSQQAWPAATEVHSHEVLSPHTKWCRLAPAMPTSIRLAGRKQKRALIAICIKRSTCRRSGPG